jgi:hypothetical protein
MSDCQLLYRVCTPLVSIIVCTASNDRSVPYNDLEKFARK